jgi:hypothetical protein
MRVIIPVAASSASASIVFPDPDRPTSAMLRMFSGRVADTPDDASARSELARLATLAEPLVLFATMRISLRHRHRSLDLSRFDTLEVVRGKRSVNRNPVVRPQIQEILADTPSAGAGERRVATLLLNLEWSPECGVAS